MGVVKTPNLWRPRAVHVTDMAHELAEGARHKAVQFAVAARDSHLSPLAVFVYDPRVVEEPAEEEFAAACGGTFDPLLRAAARQTAD
jgi:hypothetical protein